MVLAGLPPGEQQESPAGGDHPDGPVAGGRVHQLGGAVERLGLQGREEHRGRQAAVGREAGGVAAAGGERGAPLEWVAPAGYLARAQHSGESRAGSGGDQRVRDPVPVGQGALEVVADGLVALGPDKKRGV